MWGDKMRIYVIKLPKRIGSIVKKVIKIFSRDKS
ncbi:MAG: stage V sporulation protein SpoVM [Thermovenabulum sp.]